MVAEICYHNHMKTCKTCKVELSLDRFYLLKTGYYHVHCKSCNTERSRLWKQKNKHKHYLNKIRDKFKISETDYNILLAEQNNLCLICNKSEKDRRLSVDHCHKTGNIRGLLCRTCNLAIGYFNDDTTLLKNAIQYLSRNR